MSIGVPLPRGQFSDELSWTVGSGEAREACQTKVQAHWPDGSAKWLLATFLAGDSETGDFELRSRTLSRERQDGPDARVSARKITPSTIEVSCGDRQYRMVEGSAKLIDSIRQDGVNRLGESGCRLMGTTGRGIPLKCHVQQMQLEEAGPIRATITIQGTLGGNTGLTFSGRVTFYAACDFVRVELTAENPRRARHADGYWDLGDPGSVFLQDLFVELEAISEGSQGHIRFLENPGMDTQILQGGDFEVYQDSSGGDNWQSRTHLNRHGRIPVDFRGYRIRSADAEATGDRSSPVVCLADDDSFLACTLEEFWQQFPSSLEVLNNRLRIGLWPNQFSDVHELQAGEHNTRVLWIGFGDNPQEACEQLAWVHCPPTVTIDANWLAESGAIHHLPSPATAVRAELQTTLHEAIEGRRSFFAKREVIDEYGWRNFGDVWADHEETHCDKPSPVISHYNNQYDLLHGLLVQYLLTGDTRWWSLADPLARHILDIDIYHTDSDKSAYNGGLFWHTAHYCDAGTCTHRAMSRTMRESSQHAPGGGPGNEHNYASGLLLYYYLTGNQNARRAVTGLAEWVLAMDDGRQHLLGLASDAPTGDATRTCEYEYHGPGRGAGNSINVLLDAWLATEDRKYLDKVVELIQRTIHPHDDIESRELLNAELRWSYTVYLQALVRFLDLTESGELAWIRSYVKQSVIHYASWMLANERPYLSARNELEYPTETWAAQELRKGTILLMAARLCGSREASAFSSRGKAILEEAWQCLMSYPTRYFTRPTALALQQGSIESWLVERLENTDLTPADAGDIVNVMSTDFGQPVHFTSQRQSIKTSFHSMSGLLQLIRRLGDPRRWQAATHHSWCAELARRAFSYR